MRSWFADVLTLVMLNKLRCPAHFLIFSQSDYSMQVVDTLTYIMINSADLDQLASKSLEAN